MDHQEHHEMLLATTHPSGAEEWHCPTCGRRFLLKWPPSYKKIVLDPGDEYAAHSGSKGDMLRLGAVDLIGAGDLSDGDNQFARQHLASAEDELLPPTIAPAADEIGDVPITDELQPWLKWLKQADLGG